jgi:hypothetical protein
MGVVWATSVVRPWELGNTPAIAAIPSKLTSVTVTAAVAIRGWIRFEFPVVFIKGSVI